MNYQYHGGFPRGHDGSDCTMRETRPDRRRREQVHRESLRAHGDDARFRVLHIITSTLVRVLTDLETAGSLKARSF